MSKTEALRAAAQAVLDRWDSPQWEWTKQGPTADLMHKLRAALAQQPAASGEPAIHWPQVIAYKGGNGGLGAWVDVSTGDGPECVTRYFAAQPAPARVPLTDERLNAAGLDYALADSFTGKGEWVAQDIADAFKAGARAAERYYAATPVQGEPK